MTDELVKRLRNIAVHSYLGRSVIEEAAARIEALKAHYEILWETNLRIGIERERLALAICGGEDAPGYANAQTVETLEHVAKQNQQSHGATINSLLAVEAERDELAAAINSIETSNGLTDNGSLWRFWRELFNEALHLEASIEKLAAENERLAAAVDAVMADRAQIIDKRDRGFVLVMERAEKAEAEVSRLTAMLPHPGETADEVMWRNHQRGVPLAELAKAAGVTKERAREKLRKVQLRKGEAT